jgi:hypothetical protein
MPIITVDGYFKSKTGSDHFSHFTKDFENRFKESTILKLMEDIDTRQAEEKGVKFTAKLTFHDEK